MVSARINDGGRFALFCNPDQTYLPKSLELAQNYPNPFNPVTTIKFGLPENSTVKLSVYNLRGQKVREPVRGTKAAGYYEAVWDGKNTAGQLVSRGVYVYRLETNTGVKAMKMLLIK